MGGPPAMLARQCLNRDPERVKYPACRYVDLSLAD